MKTIRLLTLASVVTATMLSGCSKERPIGIGDDPAEVRFTGNVTEIVTRVGGADGTVWDADDPVGIYMFKANGTPFTQDTDLAINKRYIATTGASATFAPADGVPLYYPTDGSGVKFLAFHPQGGSITSDQELMFSVASQANLSAIDVLHAPLTAAYDRTATAAVPLAFAHKLSKLVFNVANGAGVTEPVVNGMTVAISGQKTTGELHLITGAIEVTGAVGTLTATASVGATTIEAIVIPSSDIADVTFKFTNNAGQEFDVEVPTAAWEGGKRYTYTVTLKAADKRADISGTIDPWGDGGTEAVDGNEQAANPASGTIRMTLDPTRLTRATGGTISFGIAGTGNVRIDWGDGTSDAVGTLAETSAQFSHIYAEGGAYDVSIRGEVTVLDCSRCGLTALDLADAPTLASLNVSGNKLSTFTPGDQPVADLNLSGNTVITELIIDTSDIESMNLSGCTALEILEATGEALTTLNIDGCTALEYLSLRQTSIPSLDLSTNGALGQLTLVENDNIVSLTVSDKPALQHVNCAWNDNLTELNLHNTWNLGTLRCNDNFSLQEVNMTVPQGGSPPATRSVNITNNPMLRSLDLTAFPQLVTIDCHGNALSELKLNWRPEENIINLSGSIFDLLNLQNNRFSGQVLTDILGRMTAQGVVFEDGQHMTMNGQPVYGLYLFGNETGGVDYAAAKTAAVAAGWPVLDEEYIEMGRLP